MLLAVTLATILVGSYAGVLALASALITFHLLRRSMMERIGGATGDLAGALVEFTETTILTMMIVARGLAD
jgi:adenosylcobinamide-GDP ribazoletransferase